MTSAYKAELKLLSLPFLAYLEHLCDKWIKNFSVKPKKIHCDHFFSPFLKCFKLWSLCLLMIMPSTAFDFV